MTRRSTYDESNIKVIKGLEVVRKRPGMYMGERGDSMVLQQIKEMVDNSSDEHAAGRNNHIEVCVSTKTNTYYVADKAQGIPVGKHPTEGVSTLEVIMTQLHAGGKFDDNAYKTSSGVHGVGVAATNALSEKLTIWTCRDKQWYTQTYNKGVPAHSVKRCKAPQVISKLSAKTGWGTIIECQPDQSIVSADATDRRKVKAGKLAPAKFPVKRGAQWLYNLAMLNPGLSIVFTSLDSNKSRTFLNRKGLAALVHHQVQKAELETLIKTPLVIEDDRVRCSLLWCSHDDASYFRTYVNCSPTVEHGEHMKGFRTALSKALATVLKEKEANTKGKAKPKAKPRGRAQKKDTYSIDDLMIGLVGFLDFRMSQPEFSSQTKEKLVTAVAKDVEDVVTPALVEFFEKNKRLPAQLVKRAQAVSKGRDELKKAVSSVTEIRKKSGGSLLPNILTQARKCKPEQRELYVVEGESAGGTAKDARDPSYQEVFQLTGKIANAAKTPLSKLIATKGVQQLLVALGVDVSTLDLSKDLAQIHFDTSKLRIGKLYTLMDADPDGGHITVLLLTMIWRLVPAMFEENRVFVVDAPLYNAQYRDRRYFGPTFEDVREQLPDAAPSKLIKRAKGWGEISTTMLRHIAFDPEHRSVIQVCPPDTPEDTEYFRALVGEGATARRKLLGLKE